MEVAGYLRFCRQGRAARVDGVLQAVSDSALGRVSTVDFFSGEEVKEKVKALRALLADTLDKEIQHVELVAANILSGASLSVAQAPQRISELRSLELAGTKTGGGQVVYDLSSATQSLGPRGDHLVESSTRSPRKKDQGERQLREENEILSRRVRSLEEQIKTERHARETSATTTMMMMSPPLPASRAGAGPGADRFSLGSLSQELGGGSAKKTRGSPALHLDDDDDDGDQHLVLINQMNQLRKKNADLEASLVKAKKEIKQAREVTKSLQDHQEQLAHELDRERFNEARRAGKDDLRVQETKQYQQMRDMLNKKSREVVDLRRRLQQYEKDDAPTMD